jgi:hypothetical protein
MESIDRSARDHAAEIAAILDDGDNEGAADLASQALTVFPDAAVFQRLRGVALFALGANAEATPRSPSIRSTTRRSSRTPDWPTRRATPTPPPSTSSPPGSTTPPMPASAPN